MLWIVTSANSFIFTPNDFDTVFSLQTPYSKTPAGHVLKMIDENKIDRGPTHRADCGDRLCGEFLGNGYAESGGNLGNQPNNCRRTFFGETFFGDVFCGFRNSSSKGGTRGIVSCFCAIVGFGTASKCENFDAR